MSEPKLEFLGKGCEHYIDLSRITDESVIVDAGSCTGTFIERIRKFTNARIYAIECARNNLQFLKEKTFENVQIEEKALVGLKDRVIKMAEFKGPKTKPDGTSQYHRWANVLGNHKEKFNVTKNKKIKEKKLLAASMQIRRDILETQAIVEETILGSFFAETEQIANAFMKLAQQELALDSLIRNKESLIGGYGTATETLEYEVEPLTVEDLINKYNLKQIDFFKIDIEGSEYEVFENMSQEHASMIKQMSIEIHIPNQDKALVRNLENLGFQTIKSGPNELYAYRDDP